MQRRACFAQHGLAYGQHAQARWFGRSLVRLAERADWQAIELSARQLVRLAKQVQRFRRQVADQDVLFWAQRTLAELSQTEESCRK